MHNGKLYNCMKIRRDDYVEKLHENKLLNGIHHVKKTLFQILIVAVSISLGLILLAFSTFLHILNDIYIFSGKRPLLELLCIVVFVGIILILDMVEKTMKKHYSS